MERPLSDPNLWRLILNRLHVNTIWRMYSVSGFIRRLLDDYFWKGLIVRHLGLVPNYRIDYRFYYLRAMNLPLRSEMIPLPGSRRPDELDRAVLRCIIPSGENESLLVFPDGGYSFYSRDGVGATRCLPDGDLPKDWDTHKGLRYILSIKGKLYTPNGDEIAKPFDGIPEDVRINQIVRRKHPDTRLILTKSGEVYLWDSKTKMNKLTALPEKILVINNHRALGINGNLYHIDPSGGGRLILANITWLYKSVFLIQDRLLKTYDLKLINHENNPPLAVEDRNGIRYLIGSDLKIYRAPVTAELVVADKAIQDPAFELIFYTSPTGVTHVYARTAKLKSN